MVMQLQPSDFEQWRRAHADAAPMVLDVREPWEVQTASIKAEGFELQVIAMGEVPSRWRELDPSRPIACLCHHGMRSLQVARYLQQQGFAEVVNLQGGIDAWSSAVDPTVPRY
jgi:rhodanese-related sulfurtransferase